MFSKLIPVPSGAMVPDRDADKSPILECINLGITFGGLKAVEDFNLTIGRTEIAGLIGPNGAGKTTVFNLLTKVYQPTKGTILLDGRDTHGMDTIHVNRAGIARIEGRMVADSRYFTLEPMVDSWTWDDADTYYGTNVQGLSFFENKCYLSFEPSDTLGRPARFTGVFPQTPGLTVINRSRTVEGRSNSLWLNASPLHPLEHFATGTLGAERGEVTETGANRAAGLSLLCEFHRYLCAGEQPGEVEYVLWDSYTESADTTAPGQVVLEYDSPALRTIASVTNKYSDNMYAETIFRTMGKILGEGDTRSDARRVELAVLDSIAPGSRTLNLQDGSGLSRMSFLNAEYYADFLCGMYRTEAFDDFFASLAVPGGEGTFKNTIRDCPTRTRLHIKSGTLSGVRGLAGYSLNDQGELLCFVVMVNRYHSLSPISTRMNRLLELISAY